MWRVLSGIFVGWTLGSNDSANIFGTGVAAKIIKYRTAVILISVFVILGALIEGEKCFDTVGKLTNLTPETAFYAALATGITMFFLTYLALPCSTSQAVIGAVLGAGMVSGVPDFSKLSKIVACWVLTPIMSIFFSIFLYRLIGIMFKGFMSTPQKRSQFIFWGLLIAGCLGAYALGSNNVANVTGIYVGLGLLTPFEGVLVGSLSIASGVITYSRNVMMTIGRKIAYLDEYSAFIAALSAAVTVEIFTQTGVPVSTSQAIVGGVVGVGLLKGARTMNKITLISIGTGWISTPLLSGLVSYLFLKLFVN